MNVWLFDAQPGQKAELKAGATRPLRYDYSWWGPAGHTRTEARALAARETGYSRGRIRAVHQRSGAWVYVSPRRQEPAGVVIWIPGRLRPGAHHAGIGEWLDGGF